MRSDLIKISSTGEGMTEALRQTDAVAKFKALPEKPSLQLRLLCEEMLGMFRGLTGEVEAEFYIEDKDGAFEMHLTTITKMDTQKRKDLLAASTSGKNEAVKGVSGKLRSVFEQIVEPGAPNAPRFFVLGWGSDPMAAAQATWSLNAYRQAVEENTEEWDELEKSVVASIADDIKVGILGDNVEMTIYKNF